MRTWKTWKSTTFQKILWKCSRGHFSPMYNDYISLYLRSCNDSLLSRYSKAYSLLYCISFSNVCLNDAVVLHQKIMQYYIMIYQHCRDYSINLPSQLVVSLYDNVHLKFSNRNVLKHITMLDGHSNL